jgi:lipoate-protein ligase A
MALDEALLLTAADAGMASLRCYTWNEATVSLGYFQPDAGRGESSNLAGLPWIRRATGGAAIVHHHELTYALALPKGKPWQTAESWICRMHHMVQAVLREHGMKAHGVVCGEETKLGDVLCFLHQTPADLTLNGSKVAGSAQRKLRGALLQHGSLLLNRSPHAPALPGINDAAGRELFTASSLSASIVDQFANDTGWTLKPDDWTADERTAAERIKSEKYANAAWNGKR